MNIESMRAVTKLFTKPIIIMTGASGTGKSTIGRKLSKDLDLPLFSSGSYLRSLVRSEQETILTHSLKEAMKKGKLIDSSVITQVFKHRLSEEQSTNSKGIIFDGCPRILIEAEELLKLADVKTAIYLYADEDIIKEKIMGRRECINCHKTFNVAKVHKGKYNFGPLLPRNGERCDECEGELIRREDDNEESITERMREYNTKTYPVINTVYTKLGIIRKVTMHRGIGEYEYIKNIVLKELDLN
jgi:adenylate kinase